jgi:O-methyltransferase
MLGFQRYKAIVKRTLRSFGLEVRRVGRVPPVDSTIPDAPFYAPPWSEGVATVFNPWFGYGDFRLLRELARPYTIVHPQSLYILFAFAANALTLKGEVWECGVYKGGTARMLAKLIQQKGKAGTILRLFDTFEGMPETDKTIDLHKQFDFADTSIEQVRSALLPLGDISFVSLHKGWIPQTFVGREASVITFCHVDVDIYRSVRDCCEFVYPRLAAGGVMVFDDYGLPTCPGARKAVDEFFREKPESPVVLQTGQAVVVKLPKP